MNEFYIVSVDATGQYNSNNISCPDCCIKNHKNGDTSYYHQLLTAAIVHPDKKTVIPFAPEAIIKENDATKNDYELNAAIRLLTTVKEEHPRLPILIVEDALYSKAPHINLLNSFNFKYVIGVKESDHFYLFNNVQEKILSNEDILEVYNEESNTTSGYRFINAMELNKSNPDVLVNFLEHWGVDENGKFLKFYMGY